QRPDRPCANATTTARTARLTERVWRLASRRRSGALPALGVERVVDDELMLQDLVIRQTEKPESGRDPAQPFARDVRARRMAVGGADDLSQESQARLRELVLLDEGIEGDLFAVMAELGVRHVEHGPVCDGRPVGLPREEDELRLRVDEPTN